MVKRRCHLLSCRGFQGKFDEAPSIQSLKIFKEYRRSGNEFVAALRDMKAAMQAVVAPTVAGLLDRVGYCAKL
jgi:hypothetical protein